MPLSGGQQESDGFRLTATNMEPQNPSYGRSSLNLLDNDDVEFVRTGYGKDMVKVLRIQRNGKYHSIKEVATSVELTLSSKKDYLYGDNADIIPTDTMKNTVHVLAKTKGIKSIETFAMHVCEHFLSSFDHVIRVGVYMEEVPWKRLEKNGVKHVHAFIYTPTEKHFCEVEQMRSALSGLRLRLTWISSTLHLETLILQNRVFLHLESDLLSQLKALSHFWYLSCDYSSDIASNGNFSMGNKYHFLFYHIILEHSDQNTLFNQHTFN
ncbi:uricase isoform X3 [Vicugna pacos]|uniref:Uricase n=1 Tax=Vicugna pacos TaxID=30538 RepID=A0ABM5EAP6_VICPA